MAIDLSQPAQLAALASRSSVNGTRSVEFDVLHARTASGLRESSGTNDACSVGDLEPSARSAGFEVIAPGGLAESGLRREELLYFQSGGIELQVRTRSDDFRLLDDKAIFGRLLDSETSEICAYSGRAVLNPSFLYESAHQIEVMIEFGRFPWVPTRIQAMVATNIAKWLFQSVVDEASAPIIFVHMPAAPYKGAEKRDRISRGQEAIRETHGYCLRMSIALPEGNGSSRLRFLEAVAKRAEEWGVGLHVSDHRPGRIRGEWISVKQFDDEAFRKRISEEFELPEDLGIRKGFAAIRRVRPVTIAGPARIGSSLACLKILDRYRVGIVGISVSALQEVAFINLLVACRDDDARGDGQGAYPAREGLEIVVQSSGDGAGESDSLDLGDIGAAKDYCVMIGGPFRFSPVSPSVSTAKPLWLTWDVPFDKVDVDTVLREIGTQLDTFWAAHSIQYARARLTAAGHLRGRAKVAVQLEKRQGLHERGGIRAKLSELCEETERHMRSSLAEKSGVPEEMVRLRVMWRERWLGSLPVPL